MPDPQKSADRFMASAKAEKTVVGSAMALITGLAATIRGSMSSPEDLNTLVTQLEASAPQMAQAVAINTDASAEVSEEDGGTGDERSAIDPGSIKPRLPADQ